MKKRYSTRFRNRFKYFSALLVLPVVGLILFFATALRTSDMTLRLVISILSTIALALPTLILHWSYLVKSYGVVLEMEDSNYKLSEKGRTLKKFTADDLAYVIVFKRHKKVEHETGMYYGTWYNYFFVELNFKDGDVARLPCLLFPGLKEVPFLFTISDRVYPFYLKPTFQITPKQSIS